MSDSSLPVTTGLVEHDRLRPHAEQEFAAELAALAAGTTGPDRRAGGCRRGRW